MIHMRLVLHVHIDCMFCNQFKVSSVLYWCFNMWKKKRVSSLYRDLLPHSDFLVWNYCHSVWCGMCRWCHCFSYLQRELGGSIWEWLWPPFLPWSLSIPNWLTSISFIHSLNHWCVLVVMVSGLIAIKIVVILKNHKLTSALAWKAVQWWWVD